MVTIKAKQTVADTFGKLNAGQTLQVDAEKANELASLGLVEILSGDDGKPVPERVSKGVRILDMTEHGGGKVLHQSPQDKKELPVGPAEEEVADKLYSKKSDKEPEGEKQDDLVEENTEEKVEEKEQKAAEVKKPEQKEASKKQYGRK